MYVVTAFKIDSLIEKYFKIPEEIKGDEEKMKAF